jgi:hypothetical protein
MMDERGADDETRPHGGNLRRGRQGAPLFAGARLRAIGFSETEFSKSIGVNQ